MHELFVDLDGVLVDFDEGVRRITGSYPSELSSRRMWPPLARTPGFYENLDWTSDGKELWNAVRELSPTILTGLPLGGWAEPQKRAWCARELGEDVPVITCLSRNKAKRAREVTPARATPVLIDDREWIGADWEQIGGIFIHHTDAASSIARVREIFDREEAG